MPSMLRQTMCRPICRIWLGWSKLIGSLREEMSRVVVGQDEVIDQLMIAHLRPRPLHSGRRAGAGQDVDGQHAGRLPVAEFHAHPVHARPDAQRHHRHRGAAGRSLDRHAAVALHPRAGLRQHRAGRRNQPHAAQDAGRAAGSDAGAAGVRRRHSGTRCPIRSSCWPRKIRSSRKGRIRCPKRSSIGFCSRSSSAIPTPDEERQIYRLTTGMRDGPGLTKVLDGEEIPQLQTLVRRVPISDHCARLRHGAGPRHARRRAEAARLTSPSGSPGAPARGPARR